MQPIIKWPGGKSSEIQYIEKIFPNYERYIEPFCGGAAVYFYLEPKKAIINDISGNLTDFYKLIKSNNIDFKTYMYSLNFLWEDIKAETNQYIPNLTQLFTSFKNNKLTKAETEKELKNIVALILKNAETEIIGRNIIIEEINRTLKDKFFRTYKNEIKYDKNLSIQDLRNNLITGITSGIYMAARKTFNIMEKNKNLSDKEKIKKVSLFYFVREFCYGSMFRYNKNGEFNIPYGGIGYNNKDYKKKLDNIFNQRTINLFQNTIIECEDFEKIILLANKNDFLFIDPPYDTDFSDYENKSFDKNDQIRLRNSLEETNAKFILIIKNTPFIYSIYNKECFKINSFENTYSYCVKNRNNRKVSHLIITNY